MRRSLAPFSGPESLVHTRSWADFITTTSAFRFSVHTGAFETVREKIKADPALHGQVRLVFYSFDPVHDTPETLQLFANRYKSDAEIVPWHFITSWSDVFLKSTLQSFGQEISAETDALGEKRVVIDHLLKVFLVDREGWVREIYTSAFLDPDVLMGDIQTLLLEESKNNRAN